MKDVYIRGSNHKGSNFKKVRVKHDIVKDDNTKRNIIKVKLRG